MFYDPKTNYFWSKYVYTLGNPSKTVENVISQASQFRTPVRLADLCASSTGLAPLTRFVLQPTHRAVKVLTDIYVLT